MSETRFCYRLKKERTNLAPDIQPTSGKQGSQEYEVAE